MTNRWFRLYDELLDDPKVQSLSAEDFRSYINLLCLANRNDGRLPSIEAIAFALRIGCPIACRSLIERLSTAGLIDTVRGGPNGSGIAPHAWEKRQYKSDGSTERVKRFRKRSKVVSSTVTETGPDTDTDIPIANAIGAAPARTQEAEVFERGKAVLGKNAGGLIKRLILAKGGSVAQARAAIEQASEKQDPNEYIGAIVSGRKPAETASRWAI